MRKTALFTFVQRKTEREKRRKSRREAGASDGKKNGSIHVRKDDVKPVKLLLLLLLLRCMQNMTVG